MENLVAKVSYLKGLAEGLNVDKNSAEGKLLLSIVDVLSDIAVACDDLLDAHEELEEKVDEIDQDLADIEEIAYGEDDDEDDDFDDDMDFFEIECPNCHEDFMVDFDALDEDKGIVCPNCNQEIEFEFECDCDDENCDCHSKDDE
jgi:predicted Zn finger-like uncharacterized protein